MNRILIIDDDEELCELVSEYLSAEGFEVEAVHDGESGLREALRDERDLVILDVMLPKKNGFDVLRVGKSSQIKKDYCSKSYYYFRLHLPFCKEIFI
jgi:DNA-binding response OmpR family regulator